MFHRLNIVSLVLSILMAHVCCARESSAVAAAQEGPGARQQCCKKQPIEKQRPKPGKPACECCKDGRVLTSERTTAVKHQVDLVGFVLPTPQLVVTCAPDLRSIDESPPAIQSPTLLGLHCALII